MDVKAYIVCPPISSTRTSMGPALLIVPRNTLSPACFLTGRDSPVRELSSKDPPSSDTTVPSAGGVAPCGTRMISPTSRNSALMCSTLAPCLDVKLFFSESGSPFSGSLFSLSEGNEALGLVDDPDCDSETTRSAELGRNFPSAVSASAVRPLL